MLEKMIRTQTTQKEKQLDDWMQRHDAAHPFPSETVELTPDLVYAPEKYAKIDVFRPRADFPQPLPVIVDLHGGGFLLGRKEANRLYCADLAAQGFLVYCPEYPLAPEHNLFEILQALSRALDAAAARIPGDGGDLNRVFLCGDSAGAWLCVYLAAMQRSAALSQAAGVVPSSLPVRALGLVSGMFYTTKLDQIGLFLPPMLYGKDWRRHPFRPYMNPEHPEIVSHLPPAMLLTARGDFLRRYSQQYAKALQKSGADCRLIDLDGERELPHAFAALLPEAPESRQVTKDMISFFMAQ